MNIEGVQVIIGTMQSEPQTLACSIPTSFEDFAPQPLVLIPMRWVRQSKQFPNRRGQYLMGKLLKSNVGRKFRRYLKRQNAEAAASGSAYGWGGRRV